MPFGDFHDPADLHTNHCDPSFSSFGDTADLGPLWTGFTSIYSSPYLELSGFVHLTRREVEGRQSVVETQKNGR